MAVWTMDMLNVKMMPTCSSDVWRWRMETEVTR